MRIIFDMMGTVFGSMDQSLRPGIKETIEALRENGCQVDFWTSGPAEQYSAMLKMEGIPGEVYRKSPRLPFKPDVCVDDSPEEWMPGKIFKVTQHVSDAMPGSLILVAELMYPSEKKNFYWD